MDPDMINCVILCIRVDKKKEKIPSSTIQRQASVRARHGSKTHTWDCIFLFTSLCRIGALFAKSMPSDSGTLWKLRHAQEAISDDMTIIFHSFNAPLSSHQLRSSHCCHSHTHTHAHARTNTHTHTHIHSWPTLARAPAPTPTRAPSPTLNSYSSLTRSKHPMQNSDNDVFVLMVLTHFLIGLRNDFLIDLCPKEA